MDEPRPLDEVAAHFIHWLKGEQVPGLCLQLALDTSAALVRQAAKRYGSADTRFLDRRLVVDALRAERVRITWEEPGRDWPRSAAFLGMARLLHRFLYRGTPAALVEALPVLALSLAVPARAVRLAVDLQGTCVYADRAAAAAFGVGHASDLLGAHAVRDLCPWWERPRRQADLDRVRHGDTLLGGLYVVRRGWFHLAPSIWYLERPLHDDDDALIGTCAHVAVVH